MKQLKIAASRLDKEVAAGNVSYSDVDPRIPRAMGDSGFAKRISRAEGLSPASRTPEQVARTRALNQAIFRNQHREHTLPQVPQTPRAAPHTPSSLKLVNDFAPKAGPATQGTAAQQLVSAPDTSGRFMRTVTQGRMGPLRALSSTVTPDTRIQNKVLTPPAAVDHTLNNAVLQHEFGEADLMGAKDRTMFASHFGIQPIMREQQALIGDPEAQEYMQRARQLNPDDRLIQRKLREAGSTPDRPLPVEGRAVRSVERNIAKNPMALSPTVRAQTLQHEFMQQLMPYLSPTPSGAPEHVTHNYTTVPDSLKNEISSGIKHVTNAGPDLANPSISPLNKLKRMMALYKNVKPGISAARQYIR